MSVSGTLLKQALSWAKFTLFSPYSVAGIVARTNANISYIGGGGNINYRFWYGLENPHSHRYANMSNGQDIYQTQHLGHRAS